MIDTHCHIDDEQYRLDLSAFIFTQQQAGVEAMIVPGIDSTSIKTVLDVCRIYPNYLYPALGLHPENVNSDYRKELTTLRSAIFSTRLVAIGEIGLDYHFDTTFKQEQQIVLREQMDWAQQLQLPVIIHSRDATEDVMRILKEFPQVRGVLHCFNGSVETAKAAIEMGYYLGIGGVITFKNCHLKEHLKHIPLEHLVLETDSPYMAPVPHRGERNESGWMKYVVESLADTYQCSPETIISVTNGQAKALFGIK